MKNLEEEDKEKDEKVKEKEEEKTRRQRKNNTKQKKTKIQSQNGLHQFEVSRRKKKTKKIDCKLTICFLLLFSQQYTELSQYQVQQELVLSTTSYDYL